MGNLAVAWNWLGNPLGRYQAHADGNWIYLHAANTLHGGDGMAIFPDSRPDSSLARKKKLDFYDSTQLDHPVITPMGATAFVSGGARRTARSSLHGTPAPFVFTERLSLLQNMKPVP